MKSLQISNPFFFSAYCTIAAFSTYFCMYAFRKPFSAGLFEGLELWGIDYKILLVISQILGYTVSKFIGIKIISEMPARKRGGTILLLIGMAWLSLFLFGLTPYPYNFVFMFFNGLPLGLIWGLVFAFLEGRRFTEAMAAGLSASFIVASGLVKSIGKYLMETFEISEFWMPFYVGMLFVLPTIFFVWMLSRIPPPDEKDIHMRTERFTMNARERKAFFKKYALGLVCLIAAYILFTAFRDFRDNFAADIWTDFGYGSNYTVFTSSELPVAFGVLLVLGATFLIRNNKTSVWVNHLIISLGVVFIGMGTLAFVYQLIDPFLWMVLLGLGLYLGYVPYNSMLFERLMAASRQKGNAGYLIYIADAFGYLGSILVLLYKNFWFKDLSYGDFFITSSYVVSAVAVFLIVASWMFFRKALK